MPILKSSKMGFGTAGSNSTFETDGTIKFNGAATVWEDLRLPATSFKLGTANDPDFAVWKTNVGGTSQGIYLWWFDASAEEELFFAVQMPHAWKKGSDITPHVHWIPAANGADGDVVSWGLEYTWTDIGDTANGDTTIVYGNVATPNEPPVAHRHYYTDFAPLSGVGHDVVSSMLVCRIFRDATGAGLTDSYGSDAGLMEFDIHYELDTVGSRDILSK